MKKLKRGVYIFIYRIIEYSRGFPTQVLDFKGVCNILMPSIFLHKIDNIRAYTTLTQCGTARFEGTGFGLAMLSYGMKVV